MPIPTPSLTSGGRLAAGLGLAAVVLILAVLLVADRGPAFAQAGSTLGVDMLPENNDATTVGVVQTCSEAQVGDQIAVDVYIRNVQNLAAWEFRVAFDNNILNFETTESDFALFLVSGGAGGSIFPSLSERETDGRYFLAAADIRGEADSGSGVLARLQFTVIGEGRSPLTISSDPAFLRPRLTNGSGQTIADFDGDGLWDGGITGGEVAVGEPCSVPQPPQPTPTPDAGGGSEPSQVSSSGGDTSTNTSGTSAEEASTTGAALVSAVPALIFLSDSAPPGDGSSGSGDTSGGGSHSSGSGGSAGSAGTDGNGSSASTSDDGTADSDGDGGSSDSGDSDTSTGTDGQGGSGSSGGEDTPALSGGVDSAGASNSVSGEGATGSDPAGAQPDAEDAEGATDSTVVQVAARSGSSAWPWWLIGVIIGSALVVGTGGTLLLHAQRTR